jgi:hypothetical protein
MPVLGTGLWQIDYTSVLGPDSVSYQELSEIGNRLDGLPIRQGDLGFEWLEDETPLRKNRVIGMEWRWNVISVEDLAVIATILKNKQLSVDNANDAADIWVKWMAQDGEWIWGMWTALPLQIGKRSGFLAYGVSLTFRALTSWSRNVYPVAKQVLAPELYFSWATAEDETP